jgi:hypothetical protein
MSDSKEKPFVPCAMSYLDRAMVTGRYSAGLVQEFDRHVENRTANVFPIFAEIGSLEGAKSSRPSQTKPAAHFTGKWLNGLWHKHYAQAQFMQKNLDLHWKTPNRLTRMLIDAYRVQMTSIEERAKDLAHRLVSDAYIERATEAKLTGEWIVYACQDDVAYYLTLGNHTEGDEAIWRRCQACAAEFPSLRILQENHG